MQLCPKIQDIGAKMFCLIFISYDKQNTMSANVSSVNIVLYFKLKIVSKQDSCV